MATGTPLSRSKASREKEEIGQNIQVFARCRPLNQAERDKKAFSIVEIPSAREIAVKEKPNSNMTKSYQFDKVFGPQSKQLDVYKAVVQPLIEQVMMGYNCTVFAYGQTGTGKTFTMEGGDKKSGLDWDSDPTSGIIPRALAQILDTLREQSDSLEYSVKISFLELYNEEIFDLLSGIEDTTKLRLYEDAYKKGSVIIQGLEEVQVHSKSQVYSILEQGSEKRKTAETKMNAQSSRSHTVFTVTVHIKEGTLEEEVLRIGKLNLVDLAGAENIGKSGAKDGRAREAGNINQSLLTLGRVITNLVERAPHIPYRESKLTRLLQDSLGGTTKTSIIATISPATINIEETLSTLDYASRARNILNRPEINARLSKEDLVKEYSQEMDRIRRDMLQLRDINGIYIAHENYRYMLDKMLENEELIKEKTSELIALKEAMDKKKNLFDEVEKNMIYKSREIQRVKEELEAKETKLSKVNDLLKETVRAKEEQEHLVSKHVETEVKLKIQGKKLLAGCDEIGQDLEKLHNKLDYVKEINTGNDEAKDSFMLNIEKTVEDLSKRIEEFGRENELRSGIMKDCVNQELSERQNQIAGIISELQNLMTSCSNNAENTRKAIEEDEDNSRATQAEASGIVERSSEKGKSVRESYIAQILPNLEMIAKKVADQSSCLKSFSANINEDLDKIKSNVSKSIGEIVNIVEETEKRVMTHFDEEERSISQLKEVNTQVAASQEKMKTAVDMVMTAYKEHHEEVGRLNGEAEGVIRELVGQNEPLKESIEGNVFKLTTGAEQLKEATSECVENAERKTKNSVEESEGICGDIEVAKKSLKSSSGRFVKESVEIVETSRQDLQTACSNRKEVIEHNQVANQKDSDAVKRSYEDGGKMIANTFKEEIKSSTAEQLRDLRALSHETCGEVTEQMLALDEEVVSLVWEDLKTYQPTGETPARVERHYPRYLASTEPHHRILERFRKTVDAEEAATMPQEESVDSELSYSLEIENKPESVSGKRELKKPELLKKNILKNSN